MSILDRFSLKNQKALVTGGGSGIGKGLALALAEMGADVAVADINLPSAEKTAEDLTKFGVASFAIEVDVADASQVQNMVKRVVDRWSRLDVAINSAGIGIHIPAEELTEELWDKMLNVNLKGIYLCNTEEAQIMLAQGAGSIINIASMSGRIANRPQLHAHYNASKAGVVQYSRSCAAEWANRGVRVNTISPGHMMTPMTAKVPPEWVSTWVSNTPMARVGTPEDLMGAAIYLASAASEYVTGHDLIVDGGYTLW